MSGEIINVTVNNLKGNTGATGPTGPVGPVAFVAQNSAPADTTKLWIDLDDYTDAPLDSKAPINSPTFTGNVIVPDANADGEPIAYDQALARLASAIFGTTNSYNVKISQDRVSLMDSLGVESYRIERVTSTGNFVVKQYSDAGVFQRNIMSVDTLGNVTFIDAAGVFVPDANADGEAIAYDQVGARLNGLTSTGDVFVDNATPQLKLYENDQTANNRMWRVYSNGGTLYILPANDDGTSIREALRITRAGEINMTVASKVTVPNADAISEPIAYDQASARLSDPLIVETVASGARLALRHGGVNRWIVGSDASGDVFQIQRFTNVGGGAGTPFSITADGSVLVPDANADGEPIAYDQANARVQSLYAIGPSPTIGLDATSGNATLIYFVNGVANKQAGLLADGRYRIYDYSTARSVLIANSSGEVDTTGAVAVKVPAATAATHAAQVSAYDATTGRLAIGGVEMGNTGWRRIASWTGGVQDGTNQIGTLTTVGVSLNGDGYIDIRRRGNFIEMRFVGYTSTDNAQKTLFTTAVWPTSGFGFGFRSSLGDGGPLVTSGESPGVILRMTLATDVRYTTAAGAVLYSACIPATTAWPTTLPGIQITAPFTA